MLSGVRGTLDRKAREIDELIVSITQCKGELTGRIGDLEKSKSPLHAVAVCAPISISQSF